MQARIDEIREVEGEVLAICTDTSENNADVVQQSKLDFTILSDPDLVATDAFGLRHKGASIDRISDIARPAVFVLDREGVVQWRKLTENWRIRVRADEVLEQLSAIP